MLPDEGGLQVHALLKVVVLGDEGSGKTALCRAWLGEPTAVRPQRTSTTSSSSSSSTPSASPAQPQGQGAAEGSFNSTESAQPPSQLSCDPEDAGETPRTPTVGVDVSTCNITAKMGKVKVHLWDTAGCNRFMVDELQRSCLRMADMCVVVVDATLPREAQASSIAHHMGVIGSNCTAVPPPKRIVAFTQCDRLPVQEGDVLRKAFNEVCVEHDYIMTSALPEAHASHDPGLLFLGLLNTIATERRKEALLRMRSEADERRSSRRAEASMHGPKEAVGPDNVIKSFITSVRMSVSGGSERRMSVMAGAKMHQQGSHSQKMFPANVAARESMSGSRAQPEQPRFPQRISVAFASVTQKFKDFAKG